MSIANDGESQRRLDLERGLRELAALPREQSVTTRALVRMFGCTDRTIARWQENRVLPAPFKLGNSNAWLVGAIMDHLQKLQDNAMKIDVRRARRLAEVVAGTSIQNTLVAKG